jgi:hypothetical protein
MIEHFSQHLPHYVLSGVGLLLAELLRRAIKRFDRAGETRVKANLAFAEVVERKPEYQLIFDAWKRDGDVVVPHAAKAAGKS